MAKALNEGDAAPAFRADDDGGQPFELAKLKGKNVVLYFFPKADTGIVGVSPDKSGAQAKFKDKFDLPFTLVSDVDHHVAEAYGTWVEKSMYGRKYMGMERSTFLIGKDGKIKKIFRKVKPEGHAEEVYGVLATL